MYSRIAFNLSADIYAAKFPELATMVQDPLSYMKVVQLIGNEMVSFRPWNACINGEHTCRI
jgi:RNA processing factor Prp31